LLRDVYYAGVNYKMAVAQRFTLSVIVLVSMIKLLSLSARFRELSYLISHYQSEEERDKAEDVDVGRRITLNDS
jgi:hypothetical protein